MPLSLSLVLHCSAGWGIALSACALAQRRILGRPGRIGDGGPGGQRSGDSAAAPGRFDDQPRGGQYEGALQSGAAARSSRLLRTRCRFRNSRTETAQARPLEKYDVTRSLRRFSRIPRRRRRTRFLTAEGGAPDDSHVSFAMGQGTTQGGLELQRRERRRFWVAILVVCGGGAAAHQQQLAAIDRRSERFGGAAGGGDVHDFARRHGDQYSD